MTDPALTLTSIWGQLFPILLGAGLSIIGGFFGVIIRVRVERRAEIDFIKVCIIDELNDICSIINSIKDTYKKTPTIFPSDLNKLGGNTDNFVEHKKRIFLITNDTLRKEIRTFYKELSDALEDMSSKVSSLSSTNQVPHPEILKQVEDIASNASKLKVAIQKYKYLIFWYNKKG